MICETGFVESIEIRVDTGREKNTVDITSKVTEFCRDKGDGLVSIYVPHATAGIAVFETGAGSESDVMSAIDELLPADPGHWRHEHGTPGHGRDHVVPVFISPSLTVPVFDGRPALGTWQAIVIVDTNVDNPSRRVIVSFLTG